MFLDLYFNFQILSIVIRKSPNTQYSIDTFLIETLTKATFYLTAIASGHLLYGRFTWFCLKRNKA